MPHNIPSTSAHDIHSSSDAESIPILIDARFDDLEDTYSPAEIMHGDLRVCINVAMQ